MNIRQKKIVRQLKNNNLNFLAYSFKLFYSLMFVTSLNLVCSQNEHFEEGCPAIPCAHLVKSTSSLNSAKGLSQSQLLLQQSQLLHQHSAELLRQSIISREQEEQQNTQSLMSVDLRELSICASQLKQYAAELNRESACNLNALRLLQSKMKKVQ